MSQDVAGRRRRLQDVAELRVRKMASLGGARCSRRVGRFASAFPWGEQGALLPRGSKLHSEVRVGRRDSVTDEVFGRDSQCPPQAAEERNESREVAAATLPLQNVLKRSRANPRRGRCEPVPAHTPANRGRPDASPLARASELRAPLGVRDVLEIHVLLGVVAPPPRPTRTRPAPIITRGASPITPPRTTSSAAWPASSSRA